MQKRFILYDVQQEGLFPQSCENTILFSASPRVRDCLGCFGCWMKTPGRCVIGDRAGALPSCLAACEEAVIVSPVWYGGFSESIKAALERSIGYLLPYFRIVNGEMHHCMRYQNPFRLNVHFYGPCDEEEREIARRLVRAVSVNMGAGGHDVFFHESAVEAKEAVL